MHEGKRTQLNPHSYEDCLHNVNVLCDRATNFVGNLARVLQYLFLDKLETELLYYGDKLATQL